MQGGGISFLGRQDRIALADIFDGDLLGSPLVRSLGEHPHLLAIGKTAAPATIIITLSSSSSSSIVGPMAAEDGDLPILQVHKLARGSCRGKATKKVKGLDSEFTRREWDAQQKETHEMSAPW